MNVFTEANFQEEVLNSDLPVIVDFYADWCPSIAAKYGINSIPFIGFFKGGELVGSIIGAVPKEALVSKISEVF